MAFKHSREITKYYAGHIEENWRVTSRRPGVLINLELLKEAFDERGDAATANLASEMYSLVKEGRARGESGTRAEIAKALDQRAKALSA